MAEKEVVVTITKRGKTCSVVPNPFQVQQGGFVTFLFDEPGAVIQFDGTSPFAKQSFEPARMAVRADAPLANDYRYVITWPADHGRGDGTGEIRP